jgi:formylglycine-generating enzyme required for sulfatase activity
VTTFIERLNRDSGINFRLPTEAEWELLAKQGERRVELGRTSWYAENTHATKRVATREPNDLGIFDIQGNVAEWCADWYDADYYKYSPEQDPPGPVAGTHRLVRGGGFKSSEAECKVTFRAGLDPADRRCDVGFRLVRDP